MIFKKQKFLVYSESADFNYEQGSKYHLLQEYTKEEYEALQRAAAKKYDVDGDEKLDGNSDGTNSDKTDNRNVGDRGFGQTVYNLAKTAWEQANKPAGVKGAPGATAGTGTGSSTPNSGQQTAPAGTVTVIQSGITTKAIELAQKAVENSQKELAELKTDDPEKRLERVKALGGEAALTAAIKAAETNAAQATAQLTEAYKLAGIDADVAKAQAQNYASVRAKEIEAGASNYTAQKNLQTEQTRQQGAILGKILELDQAGYNAALEHEKKLKEANDQVANDPTKPRLVETMRKRVWEQLGTQYMPVEVFNVETPDFQNGGSSFKPKSVPKYSAINIGPNGAHREDDFTGPLSMLKFYYIPETVEAIQLPTDLANVDEGNEDIRKVVGSIVGSDIILKFEDTGEVLTSGERERVFCKAHLTGTGARLPRTNATTGAIEEGEPLSNYFFQADSFIDDMLYKTMPSKSQAMFGYLNNCGGIFDNVLFRAQFAQIVSSMGEMGMLEIIFRLAMLCWQASCLGMFGEEEQKKAIEQGAPKKEDLEKSPYARKAIEILGMDTTNMSDEQVAEVIKALRANDETAIAKMVYLMGKKGFLDTNIDASQFTIDENDIDSKSLKELLQSMPEEARKKYGELMAASMKTPAELQAFEGKLLNAGFSGTEAEFLSVTTVAEKKFGTLKGDKLKTPEEFLTFKDDLAKSFAETSNAYKNVLEAATERFVGNNSILDVQKLFYKQLEAYYGNTEVVPASVSGKNKKPQDEINKTEDDALLDLLKTLKSAGISVFVETKDQQIDLNSIKDIKVTKDATGGTEKYMIEILDAKNKNLLSGGKKEVQSVFVH